MDSDKTIIETSRQKAYEFIQSKMKEYGHFPIYEFYPNFEDKKDWGWHYTYSSPFLHAHVMYSLINAGYSTSNEMMKNAADFLIEFKEPGDLWRFWKVKESEHPVFCGVDDTAICSIVLRKMNYKLRNEKILLSRIKEDGAVRTWIEADLKLFLINPFAYFWLKYYDRRAMPTIQIGWITYEDAEPSLTATVAAYLGESEATMPILNYLIHSWNTDNENNYMFYEKKIILAFHLAKAFKEGCKSLEVLKTSITAYIAGAMDSFVFAELLMAYLSISYIEGDSLLLKKLKDKVITELSLREAYSDNYAYITAKNRVYFGGSGVLTAAWFIEAAKNW